MQLLRRSCIYTLQICHKWFWILCSKQISWCSGSDGIMHCWILFLGKTCLLQLLVETRSALSTHANHILRAPDFSGHSGWESQKSWHFLFLPSTYSSDISPLRLPYRIPIAGKTASFTMPLVHSWNYRFSLFR